jgi:hypothetical protein
MQGETFDFAGSAEYYREDRGGNLMIQSSRLAWAGWSDGQTLTGTYTDRVTGATGTFSGAAADRRK